LIGGVIQIAYYHGEIKHTYNCERKTIYPLELEGRDLYIRRLCGCHSDGEAFRSEVERGPQSKAGEFVYDHPFYGGQNEQDPIY
jgi:cytochrome c oxidase cbb3-type subunit I/II